MDFQHTCGVTVCERQRQQFLLFITLIFCDLAIYILRKYVMEYGIPSGTKISHINCNSHSWYQGQMHALNSITAPHKVTLYTGASEHKYQGQTHTL